jgi:hypothetical protein
MTEKSPAANTSDGMPEQAKKSSNKAGWIMFGATSTIVLAMFYGPNTLQAYHDAQDIKHKAGPAHDYIQQALAKTVLSPEQLESKVYAHSCDKGPKYSPGQEGRVCRVIGHAAYVMHGKQSYIEQKDQAREKIEHAGIEVNNYWGAGSGALYQDVSIEGQRLQVGASLTALTGAEYNQHLSDNNQPRVAPDASVLEVDLVAYTVNRVTIDYPYNKEH